MTWIYTLFRGILRNAPRVKIPAMTQDKTKNMGAYADEPLINEEWLENYYRQEREHLELEEKL